jgi:hypothetical protein
LGQGLTGVPVVQMFIPLASGKEATNPALGFVYLFCWSLEICLKTVEACDSLQN